MYECNLNTSILNTSCLTSIELPPIFFSEVFGAGITDHDPKVSRTYIFVHKSGEKFTVYDCKCTSLYFPNSVPAPTPDEFWNDEEFAELHIGGEDGSNPSQFITWLINKYEDFRNEIRPDGLINIFRH